MGHRKVWDTIFKWKKNNFCDDEESSGSETGRKYIQLKKK